MQFLNTLLPGICVLCRRRSERPIDLCVACERAFARNRPACPVCAGPAAANSTTGVCGQCITSPPPWSLTLAPFAYAEPLTAVIEGLKSGNGLRQARILGALLSESIATVYAARALPQALVPVPLTRRRLRQRGFNQAALLARTTARALGLPSLHRHLARIRNAPPQRTLPRSARLRNVRGAFAVKRPIPFRRVALIDDVTTTGATARAASEALLGAGIAEVHVWVAAKTL